MAPASRPLRIFLIEDSEDTLRILQEYLEEDGHTVASARTKAEALDHLRDARFDLIISDLSLSDGTGWEIMEQAHLPPDTAAIAVSGLGTHFDKARSAAVGFQHHLVKPIDPDELDALLAQVAARPA